MLRNLITSSHVLPAGAAYEKKGGRLPGPSCNYY
jgi:hypothetical protein